MTEREQNTYNGTLASLVGPAKCLKAVAEDVNQFFTEQNLGDEVHQAEVAEAVRLAAFEHRPKQVKFIKRNDEAWLELIKP